MADTSVSQFLAVLIPNIIIFAVFVILFIYLRKKQSRVYEPRSTVTTVPKDLQPEAAPRGAFSWISYLLKRPESFIIQQAGVDGYFFVRYLFMFACVALFGCIILWPILFPINASNSNGQEGLNAISYANVNNKWRFLAHVFMSWIFFGTVIFLIYRELVYYTTFRHVLQTTPLYNSLLSSRILLLTEIPTDLYTEASVRELFPLAVNFWFARDYEKLEDDVTERFKLAKTYEGTLNKSIAKSLKVHAKLVKKKKPLPEAPNEIISYLKKPPTHKLKFLIGKKVETLTYGPERLEELNEKIATQQEEYESNTQAPAVFIEFPSQLELQKAYQAISFNPKLKSVKKLTGLAPDDIIWENLSLTTNKRRVKKLIASTVLTLMIIFWCIPVAVVGAISNINFLTNKVPFLKFIDKMPDKIMGIITGLLPVVALAVLMSLVPPFIKKMGKVSGLLTIQQVEAYCQSWYYAFQVVNVFLVVTLTSAAASSVTTIIEDPGKALKLLATQIPKSSNFYIDYLLLQGLGLSSGLLLQIVALILSQFLGKILDKTPRAKWDRYNTLGQPGWSVIYPLYQLLTVIILCYSIIAPLVLGFSFLTFALIYVAYIYTLVYVLKPNKNDARGRNYPRALLQTFVGLYLAEICLVAMFVFGKNWACVGLEAVILAVTVAAHLYLRWTFLPLFDIVPLSAIRYAAGEITTSYPLDHGRKEVKSEGENYWTGGSEIDESTIGHENPKEKESGDEEAAAGNIFGNSTPSRISYGKRFFKPHSETYDLLRTIMPSAYYNYIEYNADFLKHAYDDPAVTDKEPTIWVAQDSLSLAETEQQRASEHKISVVTENAEFDAKNAVGYTGPPPAYEEALKI